MRISNSLLLKPRFIKTALMSIVMMAVPVTAQAQVKRPSKFISVADYKGTANERISAAIKAAMATDHKTVFFPNGSYALRSPLALAQGDDTKLHLIGESRNGVFIIPDIPYLKAHYNNGDWENGGKRLAHMLNLGKGGGPFDSVDVSIQNLTIDMRHQLVMGEKSKTYNVLGHGIRIGTGWKKGKFLVNEVTIRNVGAYGVGIQDRDGYPKSNITLTNLLIERTGSDGIDTKEGSGEGNRNLVIRNASFNDIGYLDKGAAPVIDLRYRDVTIENIHIVTRASVSTLPGQRSSITGINFRPWDGGAGIVKASVSNVTIRGSNVGMRIHASDDTPHHNITIDNFRIQGQRGAGIDILGKKHSGHSISNGFVDPGFGKAPVVANGKAVVKQVAAARWDPALTPMTNSTFEKNASFAGKTYSPAWPGMVGSERVSKNPTSPTAGSFVFDVGNKGVMQIDFDGQFNAMDKLVVDGTLKLNGELKIKLIGKAKPAAGTYQLFEADKIEGSFAKLTLPKLQGLTWVTDKLTTDGTIGLK